jgi:type I restriction enzyme R subunit
MLLAYNKETFGESGTLGRLNKKEVVIKKIFIEKLTEESSAKSLEEINFEKYKI